ncbi:MAG: type II toxin-antitoxin system VapC family toxin [Dehalococcoidia bacterium]|nr:type II toxin-antitoxin system VapC family toxin [Dehalococcoidia bacterium]
MPLRCVDASLVVAWLVPSQRSMPVEDVWLAYAQGEDEYVAPPLLPAETLSAIRRLTSRGLLSQEEASGLVTDFLSLSIPMLAPAGLYQHAYALATRYHHSTVYDTCYLALAELLSCDLLTLDQRLYNAVKQDYPAVRLVG